MSTKAEKAALIRTAQEKDELIRVTFPHAGSKCVVISACSYQWCQENKDCWEYRIANKNKILPAPNKVVTREKKSTKRFKTDKVYNGIAFVFCHYCGNLFQRKDITCDHKIPKAKGGKNTAENLLPACRGCNSEKRDTDYIVYITYRFETGKCLSKVARAALNSPPRQDI